MFVKPVIYTQQHVELIQWPEAQAKNPHLGSCSQALVDLAVWPLSEWKEREWIQNNIPPLSASSIARRNCCAVAVYIVCGITAGFRLTCDFLLQPKLLSYELLDLVSSHFNLKEKEFFGLAFYDDKCVKLSGCTDTHLFTHIYTVAVLLMLPLDFCSGQRKWLQMDRRVLDHDFSKKSGPIALNFLVRYNCIFFTTSLWERLKNVDESWSW